MNAPDLSGVHDSAPEREPWDCPLDGSPTGHDAPNEGNVVLPMDATGTPAPASPVVSIGEKLFDSIHTFLQRFIAFPTPASLDTVTLWAAHAHMVKHFHTTPRLAMLSPEAESGKTRVLELLDLLTPESDVNSLTIPRSDFPHTCEETDNATVRRGGHRVHITGQG